MLPRRRFSMMLMIAMPMPMPAAFCLLSPWFHVAASRAAARFRFASLPLEALLITEYAFHVIFRPCLIAAATLFAITIERLFIMPYAAMPSLPASAIAH